MRGLTERQGDTLELIGRRLGIDPALLRRSNSHFPADRPRADGQMAIFPAPADVTTPFSQVFRPDYCTDTSIPPAETFSEWIPLTPLSKMSQTRYDVLIVGTGAGGSAALRRLCERTGKRGLKIGVIERGKLLLPTHALNVPTLWNWARMQRYYQSPAVTVPAGKAWPEFPGAILVFALGGRTLFWGATCMRIPPYEFAHWPIRYEELAPYYNIAEMLLHVNGAGSPINEQLLKRLWGSGYSNAFTVPEAVGRGRFPQIMSMIEFIADALRFGSFDLAVQARAVQVLTDNGRASGVVAMDARRHPYVLKADTVIIAGSTFETPRLLLNSRIPGKAIGHYLSNHAYLKAEMPGGVTGGLEGAINILLPQSKDHPYQFKILGDRHLVTYDVSGKIGSRFENRVCLDERRRDDFGVPELQVRFSHSPSDYETMRRMVRALGDVSAAMKVAYPARCCFWVPGFDNHDFGTCRMGDDPFTSATNIHGQIHGIPGLYVADVSVIPVLGAGNPLLTTVALSTRLADHVLNHLR